MKRGEHDAGFIHSEAGVLLALNLGWQHAAEHEWGIKDLCQSFGIDDQKMGIEKRAITRIPESFTWFAGEVTQQGYPARQTKTKTKTLTVAGFGVENAENALLRGVYDQRPTLGLHTAWSSQNLVAGGANDLTIAELKELYQACLDCNLCVWRGGGGGPFSNSGLILGIKSRIPPEVAKQWLQVDQERAQLRQDVLATGIEQKLREAGCRYFALSPQRIDGALRFWLNPMSQHQYNYGWFTLQDLEQWAVGRGPILKTNRSK